MEDPNFPELAPDWYMDDLLSLAHDLAERLLPAFDKVLLDAIASKKDI